MVLVAKSYQALEQVGEPFITNGKKYINVLTKKGALKSVRVYSEKEYQKMYPNEIIKTEEQRIRTQKEVLGFDKGYITILKGELDDDSNDYFKLSAARYTRMWGWYFTSHDEIPNDLPEGFEPIQLKWDLVGNEDGTLKPEFEVTAVIDTLIYDADPSVYQGKIGERIEIIITIEKAISLDGYYGPSTMHIMRDYDGNCYVWTTAAKSWEPETEHHIVGTVKEHKVYRGVKQTVLTRCRSID